MYLFRLAYSYCLAKLCVMNYVWNVKLYDEVLSVCSLSLYRVSMP